MGLLQFVSPEQGRQLLKCEWCGIAPARNIWLKGAERPGMKLAPLKIPVCLTCENIIRRNHVEGKQMTRKSDFVSKPTSPYGGG